MFETLKTLTRGADVETMKQASAELIKLVKFARENKTMLEAALNQVESRSAGLMQTAKSLERVEKRAVAAGGRLDDLDELVNTLVSRVKTFDDVGPRIDTVVSEDWIHAHQVTPSDFHPGPEGHRIFAERALAGLQPLLEP